MGTGLIELQNATRQLLKVDFLHRWKKSMLCLMYFVSKTVHTLILNTPDTLSTLNSCREIRKVGNSRGETITCPENTSYMATMWRCTYYPFVVAIGGKKNYPGAVLDLGIFRRNISFHEGACRTGTRFAVNWWSSIERILRWLLGHLSADCVIEDNYFGQMDSK